MIIVSLAFFLISFYYLYFFVALAKTGSFFGFAYLFLGGLLLWAMSANISLEKLWFKNKLYGYGWTPATWQGWTITVVTVIIIVFGAMIDNSNTPAVSDFFINFIPFLGIALAILISICLKTGEKPKWRWGKKD